MDLEAMRNTNMSRMDPRARLMNQNFPDKEKIAAVTARQDEIAKRDSEERGMRPGRKWYDRQEYTDLMKFAIRRNMFVAGVLLTRSQDGPSQEELVDALTAEDKARKFNFMELPAELRNKVYSHLLIDPCQQNVETIEKPRIGCHPTILAVCKEINKEAKNVLYANNYISLHLTFNRPLSRVGSSDVSKDVFSIDCISNRDSRNFASAVLHNSIITKVRNVNIHIILAYREALEDRAKEIKQIMSELKDYMAANTGREQKLRITFDLIWAAHSWGEDSGTYKLNDDNKRFIIHEAIEIMKPFTEFVKAKQFAHLLACEKTEVEFFVTHDIDKEVVNALNDMQQCNEAEMETRVRMQDVFYQSAEAKVEYYATGEVTEKLIKKYRSEAHWAFDRDDEDHAYQLSPEKKSVATKFLDDDEMGKDDDSVAFESDDDEEMGEDDDIDAADFNDSEDEEYDLQDLIKESKPDTTIKFHPLVMEDREIKEWAKNGGFRSELNRLRDARIARFAKD
jgi:hypothetical protein